MSKFLEKVTEFYNNNRYLKDLSIKKQLFVGFAIIVFFTIIISFISIFHVSQISSASNDLIIEQSPVLNAILEVQIKSSIAHLNFLEVLEGDSKELDEVFEKLDEAVWLCDAIISGGENESIKVLPVEDKELAKKTKHLKKLIIEFKEEVDERYKISLTEDAEEVEEGSEEDAEFDELFETILEEAKDIEKNVNQTLLLSTQKFSSTEKRSKITILLLDILFFLIVLIPIMSIIKSITNLINTIVDSLSRIANKDINFELETDTNDEVSLLYNSVNKINSNFRQIIQNIRETMNSVSDGSGFLKAIAMQISQRASEQSLTTEEIANSMDQMVETINSNTERAKATGETSKESAEKLNESGEIFVETIELVKEISNKVSVITEIADKIDILSINAAIEAARAGEKGRGFSVIAQEIRKLADKTKKSSDDITKLSEKGQHISKIAGEKLDQIIPEIMKSAKLVENIVVAGIDQQTSVQNISDSIKQLTEITNENSTTAEEMSASSEELSSQAQLLMQMISVFKINRDNAQNASQNTTD